MRKVSLTYALFRSSLQVRRRYDRLVPIQKPNFASQLICHLCPPNKKNHIVVECIRFGDCGHAFCNNHCIQKYGINCRDLKACNINLKCPVCTVTCTCKACERKLDKLCYDMIKHKATDKQRIYEIEWTPPPPNKVGPEEGWKKKTRLTTKERSNR
jgi:hypothetical protein